MFQSLRNSNQFYILHKEANPYVEIGSVTNVSAPIPKFPNPMFGQPQEMVVDVTVKVGESSFTFQKLPANVDIADFGNNGNIVVSCSKEAMNSEVASMKQKSSEVLNSVEYHRSVIMGCDKMLENLNPELAEKQRQEAETKALRAELSDLKSMFAEFMKVNANQGDKVASTNNIKKDK